MSEGRRARLLSMLVDGSSELEITHVCEVAARVTGTTGAGIMLMAGDVARGSLGTTDRTSATIEELQFALGEGPCVDAYQSDARIDEPDLAHPAVPRWLAFAGSAVDAGAAAVFCFPLHLGGVRLGALDLYRTTPGPLSDDEAADAVELADIATRAVLVLQADAAPGRLAAELEAGSDLQLVVHQATGMIAAQLDVGVAQALISLRAYAFGNERPLAEVAADVVERRVRFGPPRDLAAVAP